MYRPGELTELARSLNGPKGGGSNDGSSNDGAQPKAWVAVETEYYDTGNWCLVVRKTAEAPPAVPQA